MKPDGVEGTLRIPFNRPSLAGEELEYMRQAVQNEKLAGDGHLATCVRTFFKGGLE